MMARWSGWRGGSAIFAVLTAVALVTLVLKALEGP